MDPRIIEYIPAVLILLSAMTITIIILMRYGNKLFDKEYNASSVLLFISSFLFVIILIVHLFKEQSWTADLLKVLVGALVGTGSAKIGDKKNEGRSVSTSGETYVGGDLVGRDKIQNIEKAISDIKDSIIHQNSHIKQFSGSNSPIEDFIFHFLYRTRSLHEDIEVVITKWTNEGYFFKEIVSDFKGFDGMIIIFSKYSHGKKSTILYYRDGNFSKTENYKSDTL